MRLDLVREHALSWSFLAADFNERESPSLLRIDRVLQCAEVLLVFVDTARNNRNCVSHGLLSRCLQDGRHKRRAHPVCAAMLQARCLLLAQAAEASGTM